MGVGSNLSFGVKPLPQTQGAASWRLELHLPPFAPEVGAHGQYWIDAKFEFSEGVDDTYLDFTLLVDCAPVFRSPSPLKGPLSFLFYVKLFENRTSEALTITISDQRGIDVGDIAIKSIILNGREEITARDISSEIAFINVAKTYYETDLLYLKNNSWQYARVLADRIRTAIDAKLPFSLVRLGDGEGRILAYPNLFSDRLMVEQCLRYMFGRDALERMYQLWGANTTQVACSNIRSYVVAAIQTSDILCLPSDSYFTQEIGPSNVDGILGFASALIWSEPYRSHLTEKDLFDTFIFRGMQRAGLLEPLLRDLDFAGLIWHTDITSELQSNFAIKNTAFIQIPPHASFGKTTEFHYPDAYRRIMNSISVPFPGAVFLVGAGYLGKLYCHRVKQLGGIAIDIGSLLDAWSGSGRADAVRYSELRLKSA